MTNVDVEEILSETAALIPRLELLNEHLKHRAPKAMSTAQAESWGVPDAVNRLKRMMEMVNQVKQHLDQ